MSAIKVLSAVYATETKGIDVTATCQSLVDNGNDDITISNETFGTDPDYGTVKKFGISYVNPSLNNGNPIVLGQTEGGVLDLVPTPPTATTSLQKKLSPTGDIEVLSATYGAAQNGNDVTAICQAFINQGNMVIQANNATLGPDPDYGQQKFFSILYTSNGQLKALACVEGSDLTIIA